jgi:hypothetical protein
MNRTRTFLLVIAGLGLMVGIVAWQMLRQPEPVPREAVEPLAAGIQDRPYRRHERCPANWHECNPDFAENDEQKGLLISLHAERGMGTTNYPNRLPSSLG